MSLLLKNSVAGVYRILNLVNNKVYIGSSINLKTRLWNHYNTLKNNKHFNKHLQLAYNKYGQINFQFEIIEIINDENKLTEREQYWLDYYQSYKQNKGYNIRYVAESNLGIQFTEEHKKNIAQSHIGFKFSEEARKKMSLSHIGKPNHQLGLKRPKTEKQKQHMRQVAKERNYGSWMKKGETPIALQKYWKTHKCIAWNKGKKCPEFSGQNNPNSRTNRLKRMV